jgi:hypothetical protein
MSNTGFDAEELLHIKEDKEEKEANEEAASAATNFFADAVAKTTSSDDRGHKEGDRIAELKDEEGVGGGTIAKGARSSMDMRVASGKVNIVHSSLANKNLTGIEGREEGNLR